MTEPPNLLNADPQQLEHWLTEAGFTRVGGRTGAYSRWGWPEAARRTAHLIVPLDPTAADHDDLMRALLLELTDMATAGSRARDVLKRLNARAPLADLSELAAPRDGITERDAGNFLRAVRDGR